MRLTHAMALLAAVTNDLTGHSTYEAIKAGANLVINIAVCSQSQAQIVRAQFDSYISRSEFTGASEFFPGGLAGDEPADIDPDLSALDRELLRLLRTQMTVAEISRANYLSERSMYRRIRQLYNRLGVAGRAELLTAAAP
jgi:DNA-binding CsgD family transcriptional regulator